MHHIRPHRLEELGIGLDELRIGRLVPGIVIVAVEIDIFVRPIVETGALKSN